MISSPPRWFVQYRMDWIAETLRVFGFINRQHLQRKFGISTPQASMDLQRFAIAHPRVVAYDLSLKRYVASRANVAQGVRPSKKKERDA